MKFLYKVGQMHIWIVYPWTVRIEGRPAGLQKYPSKPIVSGPPVSSKELALAMLLPFRLSGYTEFCRVLCTSSWLYTTCFEHTFWLQTTIRWRLPICGPSLDNETSRRKWASIRAAFHLKGMKQAFLQRELPQKMDNNIYLFRSERWQFISFWRLY